MSKKKERKQKAIGIRTASLPDTPTEYVQQAVCTEAPVTGELCGRAVTNIRAIHAVFGLQTEVGELCDIFKRHIFYDASLDVEHVAEEVGDILWYLAILLDEHELAMEPIMRQNIAKLRRRFPDKFKEHDALVRDLAKEKQARDDTK